MAAVDPRTLGSYLTYYDFSTAVNEQSDSTTAVTGVKKATQANSAYFASQAGTPSPAYQNGIVFDTNKRVYIGGTGTWRGASVKAYAEEAEFPAGGVNKSAVTEDINSMKHYTGDTPFTMDPQDCGIMLSFLYSQPKNTGNTDPYLWHLNDKIRLTIDKATGLIEVSSSGGGGGTTSFYAEAGLNVLAVTSDGSDCFTYHSQNLGVSDTLPRILGTTASAVFAFGDNAGGTGKFRGKFLRAYMFGANASTDINSDVLQWEMDRLGWQPKRRLVVFCGTSLTEGYYDLPGSSVPARIAQANPTWLCVNIARGAANIDDGGAGNDLVHDQVPLANAIVNAIKPAGGRAAIVLEGGTNENPIGATAAQTNTNLGTAIAAVDSDFDYVIGMTPPPKVPIAIADTVPGVTRFEAFAARETWNRDFKALVLARRPATLDAVIDMHGTFNTGDGAGLTMQTLVDSDTAKRYNLPYAAGDNLIAASTADGADGIHGGILYQVAAAAQSQAVLNQVLGGGGTPPQIKAIAAMRAMGAIP